MPTFADTNNPLTLLLELGQAFHSTLELDPLLVSILKTMQSAVQCEGGSLWLLSDERTRLTCTHAIGQDEKDLLGEVMPAAELSRFYQSNQGRALRLDRGQVPDRLAGWVRPSTRSLLIAPLVARGDLLGAVAMVNKIGAPPSRRTRPSCCTRSPATPPSPSRTPSSTSARPAAWSASRCWTGSASTSRRRWTWTP